MEQCYRCGSQLIELGSKNDEIAFFECVSCESQYTKKPGGNIHDRWMMPITLPLYSVIFSSDPAQEVERVVQQFQERESEFKKVLVEHINEELENPKQKISEIHEYKFANESQLREFLTLFIQKLTIE